MLLIENRLRASQWLELNRRYFDDPVGVSGGEIFILVAGVPAGCLPIRVSVMEMIRSSINQLP